MQRLRVLLKGCAVLVGTLIAAVAIPRAQANELRAPLQADPQRMEARIAELAQFGLNEAGGSDRVAFSAHDLEAREYLVPLMQGAGLEVTVDFAGNVIGRREGRHGDRPPIMFGSHIDTVPNGGAYDGCVGSIGALEAVELLNEHDVLTDHPLEMIIFADEEGGLTGSRAFVGALGEAALEVVSHSGKTIREGIRYLGGT